MFNASSGLQIEGELLGLKIRVVVEIEAENADAAAALVQGTHTMDVQNIQSFIASRVNGALSTLQLIAAGELSPEGIYRISAPEPKGAQIISFPKDGKVH